MGLIQPLGAIDKDRDTNLRLLVMGLPKTGKTTAVVTTCPKPALVLNCDPPDALDPARRRVGDKGIDFVQIKTWKTFHEVFPEMERECAAGHYKSVVVDPFNMAAEDLWQDLQNQLKNEKSNWAVPRAYLNEIKNLVNSLYHLPAGLIVVCHSRHMPDGNGCVPALNGQSAEWVGRRFTNVLTLDIEMGKRFFKLDPSWGTGGRSIEGVSRLPPDITAFINGAVGPHDKIAAAAVAQSSAPIANGAAPAPAKKFAPKPRITR